MTDPKPEPVQLSNGWSLGSQHWAGDVLFADGTQYRAVWSRTERGPEDRKPVLTFLKVSNVRTGQRYPTVTLGRAKALAVMDALPEAHKLAMAEAKARDEADRRRRIADGLTELRRKAREDLGPALVEATAAFVRFGAVIEQMSGPRTGPAHDSDAWMRITGPTGDDARLTFRDWRKLAALHAAATAHDGEPVPSDDPDPDA